MIKTENLNQVRTIKTIIAVCPVGLGEEIPAQELPDGLYRISQQPVDVPAIHYGDIVAVENDVDHPRVVAVMTHSGYRGVTIRSDSGPKGFDIRTIFEKLGTCRTVDEKRFTIYAPESAWPVIARTIDQGDIQIEPDWPAYAHFR